MERESVVWIAVLLAASTIAKVPARIGSASIGQTSISRAKSGHFSTS
jgi:hypothetical protein